MVLVREHTAAPSEPRCYDRSTIVEHTHTHTQIIPSIHDEVHLPPGLPIVDGVGETLLPKGVTEMGLLPAK
jgi:hypothetical protein